MNKAHLSLTLLLIVGFILTSTVGSIAIEGTRILTGKYLGYEAGYIKGFGTYLFGSEQIGQGFDELRESGLEWDELQKMEEWQLLRKKNQDNQAIIEASGILLTAILTILGILLLKTGRTKTTEMKLFNWVGFFVSLIFVRYLVRHSFTIYSGSLFCQEMSIFKTLGFTSFLPIYILVSIGIIVAIWIVFQIPKKHRWLAVMSGMIGGLAGLILWWKFIGSIFEL
ncbi:MAG: hypothetical protein HQ522_14820 [Bacteroidetes bacterium]|nr:hypothetical protein [Bacteroidota bacterium]